MAKKKTKMKERRIFKSQEFLSRLIPCSHVVQVTRQDLSARVVNFFMKGTKLEFVLFNRQNLEDQVPTVFWGFFRTGSVFLSGKPGATEKTSPEAFYQQHVFIGPVNDTLYN